MLKIEDGVVTWLRKLRFFFKNFDVDSQLIKIQNSIRFDVILLLIVPENLILKHTPSSLPSNQDVTTPFEQISFKVLGFGWSLLSDTWLSHGEWFWHHDGWNVDRIAVFRCVVFLMIVDELIFFFIFLQGVKLGRGRGIEAREFCLRVQLLQEYDFRPWLGYLIRDWISGRYLFEFGAIYTS